MDRYGRLMSGPLHTCSFQLTYGDCDPAGIVYYANYFRWMEHTHTTWWHKVGERIDELPKRHGVEVVTRHTGMEFTAPARPFDVVVASLTAETVGRTSFRMRVEFALDTGVPVANGNLTLVTIDKSGRPAPVPEALRDQLVF
jgi:YbgC/YbaW family acyl-CoA thioester hydrolase